MNKIIYDSINILEDKIVIKLLINKIEDIYHCKL